MPVLDDLGSYLDDVGVGIAGETLFLGQIPLEVPGVTVQDALLALIEVPGLPPERVHNGRDLIIEQPVIQVLARGLPYDYVEARTRAQQAFLALDGLANVTLSGTAYLWVQALQSPFFLRTDEMGRPVIIFNVRCAKALTGAPVSPSGPPVSYTLDFVNQMLLTVLGSQHGLGSGPLLVTVYDTSVPAQVITPESVTVDPDNGDVIVTFATPQSGHLLITHAAVLPYSATFTATTSVTIPGAQHALGTADLVVVVYNDADPQAVIQPNTITVDRTTFDVTVTFLTPQSGRIVLYGAA